MKPMGLIEMRNFVDIFVDVFLVSIYLQGRAGGLETKS
jgi:hypothetical protein